jgi:hypothetical protein
MKGEPNNEIELFLMNRFPESGADYWAQWINRLYRPDFQAFMDEESLQVWLSILKFWHKDVKIENVPIVGKPE